MKLRVIGAGFGRTGTLSLKHALERLLGGRCYHMMEVFSSRGHPDFWARKGRGEAVDYDTVLHDYTATVDWPTTRFYAELAELNPEAKVVLTVRDPGRWYESARKTIYELSTETQRVPVRWLTQCVPRMRPLHSMTQDVIWGERGHFDGRFEDRAHAIAVYEAHNEEVQRTIPADRLLVYEVKQGWDPLCEFLGVPVPREPMPHVNDRTQMMKRLGMMKKIGWLTAPLTYPLSRLLG